MSIFTPKCDCSSYGCRGYPSIHSHVGCMAKGCGCQHGIPASRKELIDNDFAEDEIEVWPEKFREGWNSDNPEMTPEQFIQEVS